MKKLRQSKGKKGRARRPRNSQYYWRNLRCEGCELRCRYRDFKVFDKDGFKETYHSLWVNSENRDDWQEKKRGTILGIMHQTKREIWEEVTGRCALEKLGITAD